jgi:hypothetical protein
MTAGLRLEALLAPHPDAVRPTTFAVVDAIARLLESFLEQAAPVKELRR